MFSCADQSPYLMTNSVSPVVPFSGVTEKVPVLIFALVFKKIESVVFPSGFSACMFKV